MADGIKDKVVILGMGCTRFGERWDAGPEKLMVEAFEECLQDAGIDRKEIQMGWYGHHYSKTGTGASAIAMGTYLKLPVIPITRVENFCGTGTEALKGAAYAVAAGVCDFALALGVEKLKDVGYGGLPGWDSNNGPLNSQTLQNMSGPGAFAQLASAYRAKHGISWEDLKRAISHVSVKSHANGAKNPKAHLRKPVTMEQVMGAPIIADPLGLFDCCGVSDGAACAIVTTPEIAKSLGKTDLVSIKSIQGAISNGEEVSFDQWDGTGFATCRVAAKKAYEEAGIKNPRKEIDMFECHDCFSITEFVLYEDLQLSPEGGALKDTLDGFYDSDGKIPAQIDGGLKCFGHPIGASGIRMVYEMYLQILGRAGDRQLKNPRIGLTHNLGGFPHSNVNAISIVGRYE